MKNLLMIVAASCLIGCQVEVSPTQSPPDVPGERQEQLPPDFDTVPSPGTVCDAPPLYSHGFSIPVECNPFYFDKGRPPDVSPTVKPIINTNIKMFTTKGSMC